MDETAVSSWTEELDELFRAFYVFRIALQAGREDERLGAAALAIEEDARRTALACWERVFGAERLAAAEHQGFLDRWCLRGLERLRDDGVLSRQDWVAATRRIAADWQALGSPPTGHAFESMGPAGPAGEALRGLYLLHQLFMKLDAMAADGLIPDQARAAALENLRLRAPPYWLRLLRESEARVTIRERSDETGRDTVRRLQAAGKLGETEAGLLLPRFGEVAEAPKEPPPPPTPEPPPSRDVLVELLALEKETERLAPHLAALPARVGRAIQGSLKAAREARWADAARDLGEPPAAVAEALRRDIDAGLASRLPERDLEFARGVLKRVWYPPEPEPAPVESAPIAFGPVLELDPARFDQSWVGDIQKFAAAQEKLEQVKARRTVPRPPRAAPAPIADVPPPRPVRPREPTHFERLASTAIPALLEELSIHWLLFLGAFLVLGGGIVWTVNLWSGSVAARYLPLLLTTLFFEGLSILVSTRFKLKLSARMLAILVLLFVPMNALAIRGFGLLESGGGTVLALAAGALLAAAAANSGVRALTGPDHAERAGPAFRFVAAELLVSALILVWPGGSPTVTVAGALVTLACAAFALAPAIHGLAGAKDGIAPGTIGFAAVIAVVAHLGLTVRVSSGAQFDVAAFGFMLLGAMHVLTAAATELAALRPSTDVASTLAAMLGAGARLWLGAAAVLVLTGGFVDNPWLVFGLFYVAYVRARAYKSTGHARHLAESFLSAIAGELILLYGVRVVFDTWHPPLHAVLGGLLPSLMLPQVLLGLAFTIWATQAKDILLSYGLHLAGAVFATPMAFLAIYWMPGIQGLLLDVFYAVAFAVLAARFRFTYMVVIAVWAGLGVVVQGVDYQPYSYLAIAFGTLAYGLALLAAGRAGVDRAMSEMDPFLAGNITLSRLVAPIGMFAGLLLTFHFFVQDLAGVTGVGYLLLALEMAAIDLAAGRDKGTYRANVVLAVATTHAVTTLVGWYGRDGGVGPLLVQLGLGVVYTLCGHGLGRFDRRASEGFHACGLVIGMMATVVAGLRSGPTAMVAPAMAGLHFALAAATRHRYHVVASAVSAIFGTGSLLAIGGATMRAWLGAAIVWTYLLELLGRNWLDDWMKDMDPMLVGRTSVTTLSPPLACLAGVLLVPAGLDHTPHLDRALGLLALTPYFGLRAQRPSSPSDALLWTGWLTAIGFVGAAQTQHFPWFGPAIFAMNCGFAWTGNYVYLIAIAIWSGLMATAGLFLLAGISHTGWLLAAIVWCHAMLQAGRMGLDAAAAKMDRLLMPESPPSAWSMPLAWLCASILFARATATTSEVMPVVLSLALLGAYFFRRAVEANDEAAAWATEGCAVAIYVQLKSAGWLPDSPVAHLAAIVLSYPMLTVSDYLGGRLAVFKNPLRKSAMVLPGVSAAAGMVRLDDSSTAALILGFSGVFYNLLPQRGEERGWYYLAGILYNAGNFFYWQANNPDLALLWTMPAGLTLILFTHVNRDQIPHEARTMMRLLGTLLISGESLWQVIYEAEPQHALFLGVLSAAGVVLALHLKVKAYLLYSTLILVLDVGAFVLRSIYEVSEFGAGSLVVGGLVLIALAAKFEQGRTSLLKAIADLQDRLSDWD